MPINNNLGGVALVLGGFFVYLDFLLFEEYLKSV